MKPRLKRALIVDDDSKIRYFLVVDKIKDSGPKRRLLEKIKNWFKEMWRSLQKYD